MYDHVTSIMWFLCASKLVYNLCQKKLFVLQLLMLNFNDKHICLYCENEIYFKEILEKIFLIKANYTNFSESQYNASITGYLADNITPF